MRRQWIGVGLLLAVLILGIVLTTAFDRIHRPLADKLEAASQAALAEDWTQAERLIGEARGQWQRHRDFAAAVADHEPLEEMESWFAQLEVLAQLREADEFAAGCAHLAMLARAMADSQAITWWSLL